MVANIMLALHCKKTEAVDLKGPIWEYISNTYSVEQVRRRVLALSCCGFSIIQLDCPDSST